jgi:hypothetical protein
MIMIINYDYDDYQSAVVAQEERAVLLRRDAEQRQRVVGRVAQRAVELSA